MDSPESTAPREDELDGNLVVILSSDMRYIEIQISSNQVIDPNSFMSIMEYIVKNYSNRPDEFLMDFGRGLLEKSKLN